MKKIVVIIFMFLFVFLIFLAFYHSIFTIDSTYEQAISQEATASKKENYSVRLISEEENSINKIVGWDGDKIIYNHKTTDNSQNAVYSYNPKSGEKEIIKSYNGFTNINTIISQAGNTVLWHYTYMGPNKFYSDFINEKKKNDSYSYSYIQDPNFKSDVMEVYNRELNTVDKILNYRCKFKLHGLSSSTLQSDLCGVSMSSNGNFIVYCKELIDDTSVFYIYDVRNETTSQYKISGYEKDFEQPFRLNVSNDGKTIWFAGIDLKEFERTFNYKVGIYELNVGSSPLKYEPLVSTNLENYQISLDKKHIIYERFNMSSTTSELMCRNLQNMKEYKIDDVSQGYSFDISESDNRIAYFKTKGEGAELYITNYDNENSPKKLIYSADNLSFVECLSWNYRNDSILAFYQSGEKYKTYIIDILE